MLFAQKHSFWTALRLKT